MSRHVHVSYSIRVIQVVVHSHELPTYKLRIRWSISGSPRKYQIYTGISLNGGTPKTPENDHL